jgi:small subunit ribosomal protein S18
LAKRTQTPRRPKGQSFSPGRRKSCNFCRAKVDQIDYKDFQSLRRFLSDKGKIRSRRITGACRRHQNQLAEAVKRARELAFLPYVSDR